MQDNKNLENKDKYDHSGKVDFEVLQGDDSHLEISQVFEHVNGTEPKLEKDKKKIIVPKKKSE